MTTALSTHSKTALVMSSFVTASRVGATASAFCLRRLGIETLVLPTVMLGRHPGWGAPGGGAVDIDQLADMWTAICAQDITLNAVMSGYMPSTAHVELMAEIIRETKSKNPDAIILVDPVMGDHGRLYIPETVAQAIKDTLVPLADSLTPNIWELGYLSGQDPKGLEDLIESAQTLAPQTLVTSVPFEPEIGAVLTERAGGNYCVTHEKFKAVPHGGGDALAATFLAHRLSGETPSHSLARAVGSIFEIISHAVETDAGEMPLIREQDALVHPAPLEIRDLI